jgi:tRNA modification GTPase
VVVLVRHQQPIVAITTAAGRGAVGIVRLSGHSLQGVIQAVCQVEYLTPRQATYLPFIDAAGQTIDRGLAIYFPGPHSYTGEDVLELQAHGGPVVLQMLLARCLQAGAGMDLRCAAPGEFTQRAYLNNKLDLFQAEAVCDLIDASTQTAARCASQSLSGIFSKEIETLCEHLIKLRMLVEAGLDFPEEDVDFIDQANVLGQLQGLSSAVHIVQARAQQGALLREGLTVVLAGQPNVGKSSLLNALAGDELAIVSNIAGTTRDKVTQTIEIEGVALHVVDTAGLRPATDEIERMGIERSWQAIERAHVVIFLHDLTRLQEAHYAAEDEKISQQLKKLLSDRVLPVMHVFNKVDLLPSGFELSQWAGAGLNTSESVLLSAKNGQGLMLLRHALLAQVGWQNHTEGLFTARARHLDALKHTQMHLHQAQTHLASDSMALDLLAEELRLSHQALSSITGNFTADDLLGEIFSRFCIGK